MHLNTMKMYLFVLSLLSISTAHAMGQTPDIREEQDIFQRFNSKVVNVINMQTFQEGTAFFINQTKQIIIEPSYQDLFQEGWQKLFTAYQLALFDEKQTLESTQWDTLLTGCQSAHKYLKAIADEYKTVQLCSPYKSQRVLKVDREKRFKLRQQQAALIVNCFLKKDFMNIFKTTDPYFHQKLLDLDEDKKKFNKPSKRMNDLVEDIIGGSL